MLNQATKNFINKHLDDNVHKLALQNKVTAGSDIDYPFAFNQIVARKKSEHKIPSWYINEEIIYPSLVSLEQCSSEVTAKYKASLLSGDSFVDLTGGFGVDTAFISQNFASVIYVEKQKSLVEIATHNFKALDLTNTKIILSEAESYLEKIIHADCIFMDPSRRSSKGSKTVFIHECEPNLLDIQDILLSKAKYVLIKLSPMLDIKSALREVKNVEEVHVVSVDNECKELLLLLNKNFCSEPSITCVNFHKNRCYSDTFYYSEEMKTSDSSVKSIKKYLYEPNTSLLKAGFYKKTAEKYSLEKLHKNSHLYTSDQLRMDFPGRIFEVLSFSSMNKKALSDFLSYTYRANISIRNFPDSVDNLRKKLKIKEGGELYLFATTLADGQRILIKTKQIFL